MSEIKLERALTAIDKNHPFGRFFNVCHANPNRPIVLLFRTVIIAALYDSLKGCEAAKTWLLTESDDLAEVADYAALSSGWVRRIAHQAITGEIQLPSYRLWRYVWADLQQKNG